MPIHVCSSLRCCLGLLDCHFGRVNHPRSAALHRIAKADDHHQVKGDERLRALASKATRELVKWDKLKKPQTMSKIVWAMAKLDLRLHKLVAKVTDEALQKLPEFEPQQLVNMMWSFATLRSDAPLSDMLGALRGRIPSLAPLGRANLCWAVAKLQVREEWLLRELVQECQSAIPEMNGQNLANTSWALATLRVADDRFFESVAKVVAAQCGEFAQQNISNTAWAFAKLQIKRPEMMAAISRCVQQRAAEMPPQGIANTAWSFATLNIRDDGLMWGVQAALVPLCCAEGSCPLRHFTILLASVISVILWMTQGDSSRVSDP
ncbi:RAP [Symbiodinium sp. CCMP2592]|nr:RAP [Symbiodinium sp. CCMP2592]